MTLAAGLALCAANAVVRGMLAARIEELQDGIVATARSVAGAAVGGARGSQAVLIARRRLEERREALRPEHPVSRMGID